MLNVFLVIEQHILHIINGMEMEIIEKKLISNHKVKVIFIHLGNENHFTKKTN